MLPVSPTELTCRRGAVMVLLPCLSASPAVVSVAAAVASTARIADSSAVSVTLRGAVVLLRSVRAKVALVSFKILSGCCICEVYDSPMPLGRNAPTERPRLNLKPRTSDAPRDTGASSGSKASPFGAARPVDTDTALKRVEEKLTKTTIGEPKSEKPSGQEP